MINSSRIATEYDISYGQSVIMIFNLHIIFYVYINGFKYSTQEFSDHFSKNSLYYEISIKTVANL